MDKIKKEYIWAFYTILIIACGIISFYAKGKDTKYGLLGAVLGFVISLSLWFTAGKKNSY